MEAGTSAVIAAQRSGDNAAQPHRLRVPGWEEPSAAAVKPDPGFEATQTGVSGRDGQQDYNAAGSPANGTAPCARRFQLNSQTLAAIVFVLAYRLYGNKATTTVGIATCQAPGTAQYCGRNNQEQKTVNERRVGIPAGCRKLQPKLKLREPARGSQLGALSTGRRKFQEVSCSNRRKDANSAGNKKRQRISEDAFSPSSLHAGMAVLLRTEADEDKDWDKCWSLGRVLRIITARHSIDVVWLKPVSGGSLPPERIFAQQWVPWIVQEDEDSPPQEWKSRGVSMSSVQYGVWFPKNGLFDAKTQATLAAEVASLEVLTREEAKLRHTNVMQQTLRKNMQPLRVQRKS